MKHNVYISLSLIVITHLTKNYAKIIERGTCFSLNFRINDLNSDKFIFALHYHTISDTGLFKE